MLTLRLQRSGKKNKPEFRIILAEKTAAASKKFLEIIGSYNPRTKQFSIKNQDRLKYWIDQHVQISPTLHNILVAQKLLDAPKKKAFTVPKKPVEATEPEAPAAPAETTAETPTEAAETPSEEVSQPEEQSAPETESETKE